MYDFESTSTVNDCDKLMIIVTNWWRLLLLTHCNGNNLSRRDHDLSENRKQYQEIFVTGAIERRDDHSRLRVRNRTTIADATEGQVRSSETQIQWQTDVTLVIVVDVDCPWAIFSFDVHLHRQHYIYIDPWQNLSQCRFLDCNVDLSLNSLLSKVM